MCSQSISGSSLLSGYNEDDVRETSGRSRREFEEIDAVLYDEEKAKRSSIKKICEEWSGKPHFRIRGRITHIERHETIYSNSILKQQNLNILESMTSTALDSSENNRKNMSFDSNDLNALLNDNASGRSSIDSIEGSEITNNSDLDDNDDASNTTLDDQFSATGADSFDTDEDDDDNNYFPSGISTRDYSRNRQSHSKHPQLLIKCMKDSIVNCLAADLLQQFILEQQTLLQRYVKSICARNSIKLRPKLRPYSLPPRSLSQNRFSLPASSSITATSALIQLTSLPLRSTPEPGTKLTGLLRVIPLRITNSGTGASSTISPRKPQLPPSLPPAPPPPPSQPERIPTASLYDKRSQQQISLIGTAVANPPSSQLTISATPQSSQSQVRQTSSAYRYRSATITNANLQNNESNMTRLPPLNIERISNNEQLTLNRSNTTTATMTESVAPITRAVSGTSTGSNLSSVAKNRLLVNISKLQRQSRPITMTALSANKEMNNSSSTSPTRSITTTTVPQSSLRTAAVTRTHQQHQKRPLVTTKPPPPPPGVIKISATHIW